MCESMTMREEPKHRVSARLAGIAPSATLAVDAKSKALQAQGQPVINFAPGEPDFPTPDNIVEAAVEAARDNANHRYTPGAGQLPLREAVAKKAGNFGSAPAEASAVLITNGGKQAVFQACAAVLDEGDEVLLPAPYWTTYPETIQLAGGVTVPVMAGYDNGYKVTPEQLDAAVTDKTTALVFCSPSNPTGSVYTPQEVRAIGQWALDNGIWVITDEIYDALVYDGAVAEPIYQAVPELADQTIAVNGVAKSYGMTGWRVGWMLGPQDVISAAAAFQSHLTSNVNNVAQKAALEALTGPQDSVEHMRQAFARRRQIMVDMLREIHGFQVPDPQGAFYVFPRVEEVLGQPIPGSKDGRVANTSAELAEIILEEALVAVVPGEAFGAPGHMRLSYALSDEALVEGLTRLQKLFGVEG